MTQIRLLVPPRPARRRSGSAGAGPSVAASSPAGAIAGRTATDTAVVDDFGRNLRHACSHFPSIALVCRKLGINRPQFNRYLGGTGRPSASTLQRICRFFGVEAHEMLLPHPRFRALLDARPAAGAANVETSELMAHVQALQRRSQGMLDKYVGYYYEYYFSMAFPGNVLRSLFCLYRSGDTYHYRRLERLSHVGAAANGFRCRYLGLGLQLNERIFLLDYESLTGNELTETILYPTYKSRVSSLAGLKIGVSSSDRHEPACARVVLQALGRSIELRPALRRCGLLRPDDGSLDAEILRRIENRVSPADTHFLGRPF